MFQFLLFCSLTGDVPISAVFFTEGLDVPGSAVLFTDGFDVQFLLFCSLTGLIFQFLFCSPTGLMFQFLLFCSLTGFMYLPQFTVFRGQRKAIRYLKVHQG